MFRPLILVGLGLALAACPANNGGDAPMFVLNNSAVTEGSTTCTFTGDPTQPFTSQGVINVQSPIPYLLNPLVESRITAIMGQESLRTISLQGADISLTIGSTGTSVTLPETKFQSLASGFIAPNGGTTNVTLNLIPVDDLQAIGTALGTKAGSVEVTASVTLYGLLGGDRVDAEPFQYGVTACNNCVLELVGNCPVTSTPAAIGNPCNIFQDGAVGCCQNTDGTLTCPANTM